MKNGKQNLAAAAQALAINHLRVVSVRIVPVRIVLVRRDAYPYAVGRSALSMRSAGGPVRMVGVRTVRVRIVLVRTVRVRVVRVFAFARHTALGARACHKAVRPKMRDM